MSSVSSPPTMTTGRLIRTQRRSRGAERMTLALLGGRRVVVQRDVADRIEHRDDVAVHVDRVRDVHVAADRRAHAFGQHGLAVSGRPVEKHGLAGVDRGPELLEHRVVHDQVLEARLEPLVIQVAAVGGEPLHLRDVGGQRNGRRADVLVDVEELPRAFAAQIGERVAVPGGIPAVGAAHLHQPLGAGVLDQRLEHREGQPHLLGDRRSDGFGAVERLEQELLDDVGREARVLEVHERRRSRRPVRHGANVRLRRRRHGAPFVLLRG